ncbi:hypothetical protein IWZ03DRAFT_429204 [Phyllosticta citriasiana]|uniref:Uncharacterized protein n=1 Tax=Phyllosticta citriasiana TaxID=595635 RepID=A0ABR1KZG3_9PEZI
MSRHNDVGLEVLNLADAGNPSLTQLARTDLAELLVYVAKDSVAADGEPQRRYLQHRAVVRVGLSDSNDTHLVPVDAEDAAGGQRLRLCRRLIDLPREIDVPNARNRHVVVLLHVRDGAGIGDGLRARQAALQRYSSTMYLLSTGDTYAPNSPHFGHLVQETLPDGTPPNDQQEGVDAFMQKRRPNFQTTVDDDAPPNFPWWNEIDTGRRRPIAAVPPPKGELRGIYHE